MAMEFNSRRQRYTNLFACICEEDDGYTVEVRLTDEARPRHAAWGEEVADTFETASMLVASLAAEFSIPQGAIKIEIRMQRAADGTQH